MNATETLIRELADRAELADLVARHSLWIDEARWDETDRIFTEDVVAKTKGGETKGVEALAELARSRHSDYERTLHAKSGIVIELDGDTAAVHTRDNAVYVLSDGEVAFAAATHRYEARRTEHGWRFSRLEVLPFARTAAVARTL